MVLLTVIGRRLAKQGAVFTFMGPNSDCKDCKVKTICFHLDRGTKYRILNVRDVVHKCTQHEDDVVIVEVEPIPRAAVIPKKQAMEGTTITLELPKCRERGCQHYGLCYPVGMESGMKRRIIRVADKVVCPDGQSRVKVVLE